MPTTKTAFAALAERHRRELHVHCYRMLGSFDEAEDLGSLRDVPWLQPYSDRLLDELAPVDEEPDAPGATTSRAFKIDVLRVSDGQIAEITTLGPQLFAAFGLAATL